MAYRFEEIFQIKAGEKAVETIKYGAMDYVQKPFPEDERMAFVNKALIRRQDRIEKTIKPQVHLITPSIGESTSKHEFNVPAGIFISPCHCWLSIERNGLVRIGIDDFTQKILGKIVSLKLPNRGQKVKKGEPLFSLNQGTRSIAFPAPISGTIASVHIELNDRIGYLQMKPYELGWICSIYPTNLNEEIKTLKIGADTVTWYQKEIDKYHEMIKKINHEKKIAEAAEGKEEDIVEKMNQEIWAEFPNFYCNYALSESEKLVVLLSNG